MKYQIAIQIEEVHRNDCITIGSIEIGPEFDNLESAKYLVERLIDCVTDDGELWYVPPVKGREW